MTIRRAVRAYGPPKGGPYYVEMVGKAGRTATTMRQTRRPRGPQGNFSLENGPGTQLLDEIPLVPSGESRDLGITLSAGKYVLICNMVHTEDNRNIEVHYQLGMCTAFTVQ